jgi:hypothetical protein
MTVPACCECHSQKDRCDPPGVRSDGSSEVPFVQAVMAGCDGLSSESGGSPLVVTGLLKEMTRWQWAPRFEWDGDDAFCDGLASLAEFVVHSVQRCTTPEARIFLARLFTLLLDIIDRNLTYGPLDVEP